jgi:hypothetical protein
MTKNLGIGVMIEMLGGNSDSVKVVRASLGKTISTVRLGEDDALHFEFEDGSRMQLADHGQSCCESRYMRTDDNLDEFAGSVLTNIELKDAPDVSDDLGDVHEVQFLVVTTSKGTFTLSSHNDHNGYYGGFAIEASEE